MPEEKQIAEEVFRTLTGLNREMGKVPWVEYCEEAMQAYGKMWQAYERMARRLGQPEAGEDEDLEDMVNSLLEMQKIVALKMFDYGREYEQKWHCE